MSAKVGKPIFRSHSNLQSNDDLPLYLDPWEVEVHRKSQLTWTIVLAILKPLVGIELEEFQTIVRAFGMQKESSIRNIRKCIERYNPFLNNSSCFFNDSLKRLVRLFEKKVLKYIREKKMFSGDSFIAATSDMLKCNIATICEEHAENPTTVLRNPHLRWYLAAVTNNYGITLYCKIKESNPRYRSYSFGLPKDLGIALQKRSFSVILGSTKLVTEEQVDDLYKLPGATTNFIVTLMKSGIYKEFVIDLYNQSPHILWQLANAGFITDPAIKELHQKPAFYYALLSSEDPEILYLFYKHSTTITEWRRGASQALDDDFIRNMSNLSKVLRETRKDLRELDNFPCQKLILLEELIHINDYLLSICEKIQVIRQRNDSDTDIGKALSQRDIVRTVLDSYSYNFNDIEFENAKATNLKFENYKTFINYFKNLDFTSAVFFFDNIFLMKKMLKLDDDWYEKIESSFVNFMYTCKWYQHDAILYSINVQQQLGQTSGFAQQNTITDRRKFSLWKSWFSKDSCSEVSFQNRKDILQSLAYYSRIAFQPNLDAFRDKIYSVDISEALLRDLSDYDEKLILIYNLKTADLIKDELLIFKLYYYLDLAISLDLTEDTENGVLIILRTFQILGESMHSDVKDPPTVTKSLLASSFSDTVTNTFVEVRNSLCHRKAHYLYHHLQIENRKQLFENIQAELKNLEPYLRHIFVLHLIRVRVFTSKRSLDLYERHIECKEADLHDENTGGQEINEAAGLSEKQEKVKEIFQKVDFKSILKHDISEMEGTYIDFRKFFVIHLRNHVHWIEGNIMKTEEAIVSKLKYRFLSLQKLLSFLIDEIKIEKHLKELFINILEDLNSGISSLATDMNKKYTLAQRTLLLGKIKNMMTEISSIRIFSDPEIDNIKIFLDELNIPEPFPPEKIRYILSEVIDKYRDHHSKLKDIIDSLPSCSELSQDGKMKEKMEPKKPAKKEENLVLKAKQVKKLHIYCEKGDIESIKREIPDRYSTLENYLTTDTLDKSKYEKIREEELCSVKALKVMQTFLSFRYGELDFFRDRVVKIKQLVLKGDVDIYILWRRAEGLRTKRYLEDRIISVYMQNSKLRVTVEMLLYDCLNLFIENARIKEEEKCQQKENIQLLHLRLKTNGLCCGIDIRNLLAHGNPLAEAVMSMLDPGDLPHAIVKKLLEFVSDLNIIQLLCQLREDILYQENKYLDYDYFLHYCSHPKEIHRKMIMTIKKCRRWEFYAKLLP